MEKDGVKVAVTSVEGEGVSFVAMLVVGREKVAVITSEAVGKTVEFSPERLQPLKIAPPINIMMHVTFKNFFIRHIHDLW